ncbi:MAG: hypothetical protein AB7C98_04250 [Acidithiobacillus sp.]
MKSTQFIGLVAEHQNNPQTGNDLTVADLLSALEERQKLINGQWQEIMQRLPEDRPDAMMNELLLMDHELARYQRFFVILKETLHHRESGLLNAS